MSSRSGCVVHWALNYHDILIPITGLLGTSCAIACYAAQQADLIDPTPCSDIHWLIQ